MRTKTFVNWAPAFALGAVYFIGVTGLIAFKLTGSTLVERLVTPAMVLTVGAIGVAAITMAFRQRRHSHDAERKHDMKRSARIWVSASEVHGARVAAKHFECGRCGETFELAGNDAEPPSGSSEVGVCEGCWGTIAQERANRLGLGKRTSA